MPRTKKGKGGKGKKGGGKLSAKTILDFPGAVGLELLIAAWDREHLETPDVAAMDDAVAAALFLDSNHCDLNTAGSPKFFADVYDESVVVFIRRFHERYLRPLRSTDYYRACFRAHQAEINEECPKFILGGQILLQLYSALDVDSRVFLSPRTFKGDDGTQVAVRTRQELAPHTVLMELVGLGASDAFDHKGIDDFSAIDVDGSPRLLVGPARLLNHSCTPNCEIVILEEYSCAVVIRVLDWIVTAGTELTVCYAEGFFGKDCECGSAQCSKYGELEDEEKGGEAEGGAPASQEEPMDEGEDEV